MTLQLQAQNTYARVGLETATDRTLEMRAFEKITQTMSAIDPVAPGGFSALAEALLDNNKLWAVLVDDIRNEDNMLPHELKKGILHLEEFTRLHALKVMAGSATIEILVEINTSMIRGLSRQVETLKQHLEVA